MLTKKSRERDAGNHAEEPIFYMNERLSMLIHLRPSWTGIFIPALIRIDFSFYKRALRYNITCFVIGILNSLNNVQPPAEQLLPAERGRRDIDRY